MAEPGMVIAAVIERNGRYLICQRPAHKRHGGLWEFPGGKLEAGESFFDAAKRELEEELALQVSGAGEVRYAITDEASGLLINFVDVKTHGEPQLLEHAALNWCTPDELLALALAPTDSKFAQTLTV